MRGRRFSLLLLALAAVLVLVTLEAGGCRKKAATPHYPGPAKLPTAPPYHPPPTKIWPTLLPGQPTVRPPIPR